MFKAIGITTVAGVLLTAVFKILPMYRVEAVIVIASLIICILSMMYFHMKDRCNSLWKANEDLARRFLPFDFHD